MVIILADVEFLSSESGARLLQRLAAEDLSEANSLRLLTSLRQQVSPSQAGAALEMARLRLKAIDKFGDDANRLLFTREALEQASDPQVRRYRSRVAKGQRVLDICCGIGSDALAMAQAGSEVLGLDIDPVRVAIARYNAAALGLKAHFEVADVRATLPDADMAFYDPARRDGAGHRLYDVERYEPPLSLIRSWKFPRVMVKLSPGVNLDQLAGYGGGVEFISVNGDLKEAVLWLGGDFTSLKATLLINEADYHWQSGATPAQSRISDPRGWLVEPDPSLLRAGLVANVSAAFDGFQLDETIAYFTTYTRPDSPWLRSWQILDWMPFQLKRLRAYLRERSVGNVTVKKRGVAIKPEELSARLKLQGGESRTLVLTRCAGKPIVLICADLVSN